MKDLVKHYKAALIVMLLPYAFFLFLFFYQVDFYVNAPGGLTEVADLITIDYQEDKEISGSISTTYVMALPKVSYFQLIVGNFSPYTTIGVQSNTTYSVSDHIQIGYLDKVTSVNAAIIIAYQKAAETNSEIAISYETKNMVYGKAEYLEHYQDIAFGDEFVQLIGDEGVVVSDYTKIAENTTTGNSYDFTFINDSGDEYTVNIIKNAEYGLFGLTIKTYYIVDQDLTYPTFTENNSTIGGPSGGLLQTLSIYNMLIDEDLTHGLKIAGTGTIDYAGNVGAIGAVQQKILTAYFNKVDLFFIPEDDGVYNNYSAAVAACEKYGIDYDGWLIKVSTFDQAVDYLEGLG